jgi:glycolate oxidase iron-sulfur subunit
MGVSEKTENGKKRDVTGDFLLCNRCGSCRFVCPLISVYREEWAGARGKVELAEAFFRGEKIDDKELRKIFDLCLHCMTCEENCPSGVRADEIVMAARAEMARRGMMPRVKRLALRLLEGADNGLFRIMRLLGLVRRGPLHGVGGKSPLSIFYPLLGWPRERFIPLPAEKPFLASGPELYPVAAAAVSWPDGEALRRLAAGAPFDRVRAEDLARRAASARERNLAAGARVYFFVGHSVNNFFPEEARAVVRLLNILGIDVLAPRDQLCCGAPVYYAGDIEGARESAMRVLESLEGKRYDWIVSTCSSGSLMLKNEFPRLFDLNYDGYFEISWDPELETFRRNPERSGTRRKYARAEDLYRNYVEGKVRDVNELVADMLGLSHEGKTVKGLFGEAEELHEPRRDETAAAKSQPVVTYHHPCHLSRGQDVDWQPEAILEALPGYRFVRMKDADRCCGGGGAFAFLNADASAEIARVKMDAVAAVRPAVVATACPLCRIQLMDMIRRRFGNGAKGKGKKAAAIPVRTPAELLLEDLESLLPAGREAAGAAIPAAR